MTVRQLALLFSGCVVLGAGVALLLAASLGSDGYSTLVNGVRIKAGIPFLVSNLFISAAFLALAWVRGVVPSLGTLVQILVVGGTVSLLLPVLGTPDGLATRAVLLVVALPVLAVGIASYLGSQTGAGPGEAFAQAWDPPVPFRWSYSAMQGGGAVVGWLLGAAIGPGTFVVIFLLGPGVDLTARLMRLDVGARRVPQP
jgi:uncharacterized protein